MKNSSLYTFLKQRSKLYLTFLLFLSIFFISFILYRLPLIAVVYPAFLCILIGGGIEIYNYFQFKSKHEILSALTDLSSELISSLPEGSTLIERDYRKLVYSLQDEINTLKTDNALKYNEMLEYFTIWVHQIKTPITAIGLILDNEDTPLSRALSSEVFRISQYVDMVLTYLRLGSETTDYVFKKQSLDRMIKNTVKKFSSEFINRRLPLNYKETDLTLITDEKWFSFILEQILSNALKYTSTGNITIYTEDNKLYIKDTGCGIAPEDLPRIFQKGYTGYNGRVDQRASGIGLYLSKQISEALGLNLEVSSQENVGTTVILGLDQSEFTLE